MNLALAEWGLKRLASMKWIGILILSFLLFARVFSQARAARTEPLCIPGNGSRLDAIDVAHPSILRVLFHAAGPDPNAWEWSVIYSQTRSWKVTFGIHQGCSSLCWLLGS